MKKLNKRQRDILSLAEDEGYVSVESLAETFSVTQQTIRSDINNFCDQELLTRAHGGAFYSKEHNFAYKSRKSLASDEKKKIAVIKEVRAILGLGLKEVTFIFFSLFSF